MVTLQYRSWLWFTLLVSFASSSCTSSALPDEPGGQPREPSDEPSDEPQQFELRWGPLMVEPGVEEVRCVTLSLGNETPVVINEIHNQLGTASHHFILYRAPAGTPEQREPYRCESIQNLVSPEQGAPLMITQKAEETLRLPAGVGFELEAEQMLRLELHFINASDAPQSVEVISELSSMPAAELEHAADFLFIGNPDIELAPGASQTLGPVYFPLPAELEGSRFFGLTGHQHQWGTDVWIAAADDASDPGTPVYDLPSFNWSEPETVHLDPPLQLPPEGGFRFSCTWNNRSERTVYFGEGVDDEMCFFWAYYYPSAGARTCFHTERGGSPVDICCPGSPFCRLIDELY